MYSRGIETLLCEEVEKVVGALLGQFSCSDNAVAVEVAVFVAKKDQARAKRPIQGTDSRDW